MSAGDLDVPVPVPEDPPEIRTLARSLEESRVHLQENLGRLKRQEDWSDTLLRSIVEGIVTIDAQGKATSFGAAAERITGWRAEEVVGRRIDDVFRTVDGDPFSEEIPHPRGKRSVRVLNRSGRPLTLILRRPEIGCRPSASIFHQANVATTHMGGAHTPKVWMAGWGVKNVTFRFVTNFT